MTQDQLNVMMFALQRLLDQLQEVLNDVQPAYQSFSETLKS